MRVAEGPVGRLGQLVEHPAIGHVLERLGGGVNVIGLERQVLVEEALPEPVGPDERSGVSLGEARPFL